jgi:hypothetical protein
MGRERWCIGHPGLTTGEPREMRNTSLLATVGQFFFGWLAPIIRFSLTRVSSHQSILALVIFFP